MCLFNYPNIVTQLLKSKKKKVKCYKVLEHDEAGNLSGPYQFMIYQPGWNISDSKLKSACLSSSNIEHGVHVYATKNSYTKKSYITSWAGTNCIILECTALMEDLLGASPGHRVFKKIHISEKEFKRATQLAKRRMRKKNVLSK